MGVSDARSTLARGTPSTQLAPMNATLRAHLLAGQVIPALPLALDRRRRWDEARQRAVIRYYVDAGAGGLAVGVHSTQFAIRDPQIALHEPVLALARETVHAWRGAAPRRPFVLIAGVCGRTPQAQREAALAARLGYHAGLLSLGAWGADNERAILRHCRAVARELPLVGFYLQPAVGGRVLSYRFWRDFAEIPGLVAVKIAPFHRYRTLDVVRAVLEAGRDDVALYTGNDDNILADLLTPFTFGGRTRHITGGLLGQWGVWTERAVALLDAVRKVRGRARLDAARERKRRTTPTRDHRSAWRSTQGHRQLRRGRRGPSARGAGTGARSAPCGDNQLIPTRPRSAISDRQPRRAQISKGEETPIWHPTMRNTATFCPTLFRGSLCLLTPIPACTPATASRESRSAPARSVSSMARTAS